MIVSILSEFLTFGFIIFGLLVIIGYFSNSLGERDNITTSNASKIKNDSSDRFNFSYVEAKPKVSKNDGEPRINISFDPFTNKITLRKEVDGELLKLTSKEIDGVLEQLKRQVKEQDGIVD